MVDKQVEKQTIHIPKVDVVKTEQQAQYIIARLGTGPDGRPEPIDVRSDQDAACQRAAELASVRRELGGASYGVFRVVRIYAPGSGPAPGSEEVANGP